MGYQERWPKLSEVLLDTVETLERHRDIEGLTALHELLAVVREETEQSLADLDAP